MLRFDLLPRLMPDHYCDTLSDAHEEMARRKASPVAPDAITRIAELPYRGYRVFTVSMSFAMDMFMETPVPEAFMTQAPSGTRHRLSPRPSRATPRDSAR